MIEDLQRFIAIVEQHSITKAAKTMHITQPAMSLSLQRLEKATKTILFSRSGKQFKITLDGQAIYRISMKIIELWEKAKNPELRNSAKQHITIGLFDNAALKLAKFFQTQLEHATLQIEIKIDSSIQLLQDIQYGINDICICVLDDHLVIPKNAQLIKRFTEKLLPVSARHLKDTPLDKIPIILYKKGSITRISIDQVFTTMNIKPYIVAESTSTTFMKELAVNGSGVALLPLNFVKNELRNNTLHIHPLPMTFQRTGGIFIRKDGQLKTNDPFVQKIASYFQ